MKKIINIKKPKYIKINLIKKYIKKQKKRKKKTNEKNLNLYFLKYY